VAGPGDGALGARPRPKPATARPDARPGPPRDVPLPETMTVFAGTRLEAHGDYDAVHFVALDLADQAGDDAGFLACWLERCGLDGVSMRRARVSECRLDELRATSLDAADSVWRDTVITVRRVGALLSTGGSWSSVRVRGGRLDLVDLSGAKLTSVAFEECVIGELDLGTVEARDLSFEGCEVELLDVTGARLVRTDLTGASIHAVRGVAGLRGATVTPEQLIDLAPAMAANLGIKVREAGPALS
jgi:uncharacterized protein YjbI with pentapeptide repeats